MWTARCLSTTSQGYHPLCQALVNYYERYQIKLNADEIIMTSRGSEVVMFAFMSCLTLGYEIIVTESAYANYMSFVTLEGTVIRTVATTIEEGFLWAHLHIEGDESDS